MNGIYFFVMKRIKDPAFDINPSYGPFIRLKRIGKNGKTIKVYKLRTMYPFAEYLQDYVHKRTTLRTGGSSRTISRGPLQGHSAQAVDR